MQCECFNTRGVLPMNDVDDKKIELETPNIIVCSLDVLDWLILANGTVLVDYNYILELQRICGG